LLALRDRCRIILGRHTSAIVTLYVKAHARESPSYVLFTIFMTEPNPAGMDKSFTRGYFPIL
jgi:hypothetical protein